LLVNSATSNFLRMGRPTLVVVAKAAHGKLQAHAGQHHHHRRPHPTPQITSSATSDRPIAPIQAADMADETPKTSVAIPRTTRPMSEALLNEKVRLAHVTTTLLWLTLPSSGIAASPRCSSAPASVSASASSSPSSSSSDAHGPPLWVSDSVLDERGRSATTLVYTLFGGHPGMLTMSSRSSAQQHPQKTAYESSDHEHTKHTRRV